jgi:hypothetical protein
MHPLHDLIPPGWLLILIGIVLILVLLARMAERAANRQEDQRDDSEVIDTDNDGPPTLIPTTQPPSAVDRTPKPHTYVITDSPFGDQ